MYQAGFYIEKQEGQHASFEALLCNIAGKLKRYRAGDITVGSHAVTFAEVGPEWHLRWNPLGGINCGKIVIDAEAGRLCYQVRFLRGIVVPGVVLTALICVLKAIFPIPVGMLVAGLVVVWGWGVGMAYLLTLGEFERMLKKCIRQAGFTIEGKFKGQGDQQPSDSEQVCSAQEGVEDT